MKALVYIRKHNESKWQKSGKSKWINTLLEGKVTSTMTKKEKLEVIKMEEPICPHNHHPNLCQFESCRKGYRK